MIAAIKRWLYSRKLETAIAQRRQRPRAPVNNAAVVGIITDTHTDQTATDRLVATLERQGRAVHTIEISDTRSAEPRSDTIYSNETTWYGWPISAAITEFLSVDYDICIVLAMSASPVAQVLIATVTADLLAGGSEHGDSLDLMIDAKGCSTQELITKLTAVIDVLSKAA